ncbi:exonuclease domain-containing protein [Alkalihalobacillus sp. MEB130]|uniref:3'-5' exonuclease n=1 Tax=Alkalihalobacillus sp. MEB130 TaxID=2976704 RepID=UPI0028DD7486|nr:3'-5' exonuclease [Alkalihalobacillus sp. MEB130]MDT8861023.1 exonuclease domain-containing protein [Alkalihalobacillus sp. MEB130]
MAEVTQFVFFDFEMLCSEKGMTFESMEAIRLGAVKYNIKTGQITTFDQYIKPKSNQSLSSFCKELTGIDDAHLKKASSFKVVFEDFLTWVGGVKKSRFFSWSPSDISRLRIDAAEHSIPDGTITKINKRYVDFQAIFSKRVSKTNASVESALRMYGLPFIGEKHNPMYDSYNTLRIYLNFLNEPIESDLLMLKHFIFDDEAYSVTRINQHLTEKINHDLSTLIGERDVFHMKDARKMLKRTRNLVNKYNNILINRSGLFSKENMSLVDKLTSFYHEFLGCFEEHHSYSSKVIILDDFAVKRVSHLQLKQG